MKIKKIKKNILVFGLGVSGMSLANSLKNKVENLFCWDDNLSVRKKAIKSKLNIKSINDLNFKSLDYLVLSPGINHKLKKPHLVVLKALEEKVKITTDLEFIDILGMPNLTVGITGTNGKSTTTKFIEHSLTNSKKKCIACGNIGVPLGEITNNISNNDLLAVEVSSFQLDKILNLKFNISILLNLSKDHLDWHGSWNLYVESKMKIFENQDNKCFAIICVDDRYCEKIAKNFNKKFKSQLIRISTQKKIDDGIYLKEQGEKLAIVNNLNQSKILIDKKKLKFTKVNHNFQNLLASYVCHFLLKRNDEAFLGLVYQLKNLEHRLEFITKIKNISIFNDSKATNINSAKNAIKSLSNIYWILGGRKKKGGINGIESNLNKIVRAYTYGESGEEFNEFLKKKKIKSYKFLALELALEKALKDGFKENREINLLFSPACSSFDQFKNYEHRGRCFKKHLKKVLKNE